jgi:cyanophycin synthetase
MVAAARGDSEYVVGDGRQTIRELIDEVNRDPLRGENYTDALTVLTIDAAVLIELKKQDLTPESVPPAGQRVLVHPVGDLTTDVTDQVHPANATHAVLAAKAVGLDIAGIDLVAEDISRPLQDQRGMVLEVNAGPSLSMHITPLHGRPQPVGEAIVEMLYATGETGRVPIVAVTGLGDRTRVVEQVEQAWQAANLVIGAATHTGARVAGRCTACSPAADAERVRDLLLHPQVEAVVFESRPAEAAAQGMGCPRCDLVVVVPEETPSRGADSQAIDGIVAAVRAIPATGAVLIAKSSPAYDRVVAACRGRIVDFTPEQLVAAVRGLAPAGIVPASPGVL